MLLFAFRIHTVRMTEMEGIPLKRSQSGLPHVDVKKCIICQTNTTEATSSTAESRLKILESSRIRNDVVARRLEQVNQDDFVYHVTNKCYKSYTLKKTLDRMKEKMKKSEEEIEKSESDTEIKEEITCNRTTRAKIMARNRPSEGFLPSKIICTVCGKEKLKRSSHKFRVCEDVRAEKLLKAVVFFQDDVYYRMSDL